MKYYFGKKLFKGIIMVDEDYTLPISQNEQKLRKMYEFRKLGATWLEMGARYGYDYSYIRSLLKKYIKDNNL